MAVNHWLMKYTWQDGGNRPWFRMRRGFSTVCDEWFCTSDSIIAYVRNENKNKFDLPIIGNKFVSNYIVPDRVLYRHSS